MTLLPSARNSVTQRLATDDPARIAGQTAARKLLTAPLPQADIHAWICSYLQGFLDELACATERSNATPCVALPTQELTNSTRPPTELFAARIVEVTHDQAAATSQITLDIDGSALRHQPGCSVALWPSNDPDLVRDVIRALCVSAQTQIVTAWGVAPLWQVLLEQLDLSKCSSTLVTLLGEHSRNPEEAVQLALLARAADTKGMSVLALLRRHPQARPPLELLLSRLVPIEAMPVPIASAKHETKTLKVSAKLSEPPLVWGHVDANMRARFRVGEWITLGMEVEATLPLPQDELLPTIIIGSHLGLAFAHAFVKTRQAFKNRGRTWVIALASNDAEVPFASELQESHAAGVLGRFDVLRGATVDMALESFARHEEDLWRWLVDQSCLCLALEDPGVSRTCLDWVTEVLMRRGRLERSGATDRIVALDRAGRFMQMA